MVQILYNIIATTEIDKIDVCSVVDKSVDCLYPYKVLDLKEFVQATIVAKIGWSNVITVGMLYQYLTSLRASSHLETILRFSYVVAALALCRCK